MITFESIYSMLHREHIITPTTGEMFDRMNKRRDFIVNNIKKYPSAAQMVVALKSSCYGTVKSDLFHLVRVGRLKTIGKMKDVGVGGRVGGGLMYGKVDR